MKNLKLAILPLALYGSAAMAQVLDCEALANSQFAEPAGYAEQCGPFPSATTRDVIQAPTDNAIALDVRGNVGLGRPANTIYDFVLNDFPGQTALSQTNPSIFALDYSPDGTTLYAIPSTTAASNPNTLGTVDPATGAFTPIAAVTGDGGLGATGLTIHPVTGQAYISQFDGANSQLASIDLTSGVVTPIGIISSGIVIDLAMNCEGQLYAHNIGDDSLYSVDPVTGAGTLIGTHGLAANFAQGMDFDNNDGTLYGFIYTGGGTNTFGIFDLGTGAITPLAVTNPDGEFEGAIPTTCPAVFETNVQVPTLDRNGLVLAILLMLALGLVAVRRFS